MHSLLIRIHSSSWDQELSSGLGVTMSLELGLASHRLDDVEKGARVKFLDLCKRNQHNCTASAGP